MKRPAIFFDRDNTLIVSDGYLGDPERVVLMDGAADAVARARSLGFATVVVSNQSGVARGMFGEDDVDAVNRRLDEKLRGANSSAVIDRHEFCPFHPEATVELYRQESDLRKPAPGMILGAAEKLALDLPRSWVVGDAPRDIEAGRRAGCRAVLLKPAGVAESPAAAAGLAVQPDAIVSSLNEAIDFIERAMHEGRSNGRDAGNSDDAASAPARVRSIRSHPVETPDESASPPPTGTTRLEQLAELILLELRKRDQPSEFADFSVSRLLAGIVQVIALAALFLAYLFREDGAAIYLLFAIYLQTLTVALLVMARQK